MWNSTARLLIRSHILSITAILLVSSGCSPGSGPKDGDNRGKLFGLAHSLEVNLTGDIQLSSDGHEVLDLSEGGSLRVSERSLWNLRTITISKKDGRLLFDFELNGKSYPYDNRVRDWFSKALPIAVFETGMHLRTQIISAGSKEELRDLVDQIEGYTYQDAKIQLYTALLGHDLTDSTIVVMVGQSLIRQEFSNSKLLDFVRTASPLFTQNQEISSLMIEIAGSISSSSGCAHALGQIMKSRKLHDDDWRKLATRIARIESSSNKSLALKDMLDYCGSLEGVMNEYILAVESIGSSHEKALVLSAVLKRESLSNTSISRILEGAATISSSSAKSQVLVQISKSQVADARVFSDFLNTLATISSSSDKCFVLRKLVEMEEGRSERLKQILEFSNNHVGSSSERQSIVDMVTRKL